MKEPVKRLRIDAVLVEKFKRLRGGINEVGVKIVRDLGLKYEYDKRGQTLDLIGPDAEILALGIETLRFWIEDDDYPSTGITCQIGYPNRHIVVWRFHGDYAKKFDHLFSEEIAQLKLVPTLNIKAVPSKRNPSFVELYCHFTFFRRVKQEIEQISYELSRVFQDDFFVPKSDHQKARQFAKSKAKDHLVLFALKELQSSDNLRVWIFAREQASVFRARREWLEHVGEIARDTTLVEKSGREVDIKSASYIGVTTPSTLSTFTNYRKPSLQDSHLYMPPPQPIKGGLFHKPGTNGKAFVTSPRYDDPNFPRPDDFVYPINSEIPKFNTIEETEKDIYEDPFAFGANEFDAIDGDMGKKIHPGNHPNVGEAKWVSEDEEALYKSRLPYRPVVPNRIYVHHQMNEDAPVKGAQPNDIPLEKVVHPETNLIARERFNIKNRPGYPLKHAQQKQTAQKKFNTRRGLKMNDIGSVRKQPKMPLKKPEVAPLRYKISINGLDIVMYKHSVAKLDNMDAIVNPVKTDIISGGQIAQAVYEAAGKLVIDEVKVHKNIFGDLSIADNVVTSAGKIPALGIIHVAAPVWADYGQTSIEDCARDLHQGIYRTLKTAEAQKYRKVGVAIISGEPCFGVPKDLIAEVYVKALIDYSMGMGPLYPVLEIHLVDLDTQMLLKVKEAYEKWASDPGVMEMAQNLGTVQDPLLLSELKQSAVALEDDPSHTSENMVTFLEQTYNEDGNQRWTFSILGRLKVHVYTGSIIRVDSVESIACGVDENIRGTLAKSILHEAGVTYEKSLSQARGSQDNLEEGDIVVTNAGRLGMALVMHAVISQPPVYKASFTNLERLENVNSNVLDTACNLGIVSLAIPLLGTGRLREKFEIEQCGLQLIDLLIELVLSLGTEMSVRELHLVNENHVVTQAVTQALRTRAHTQLRLEAEPRTRTRQHILSTANTTRPKKELTTTEAPEITKESATEKKSEEAPKTVRARTIDELKTNPIGVFVKHGKRKKMKERVETEVTTKENVASKLRLNLIQNKRKGVRNVASRNSKESDDIKEAGVKYLSETNLKTHDKIQSGWVESTKIKYRDPPRRHNQLDPLPPKEGEVRQNLLLVSHRPPKPKQPLNTKYVMQRSKAESYKDIYDKKRDKPQSTPQKKLRRTQSTDGMLQNTAGNDIFEGFEKERMKLERLREVAPKGESSQRDILQRSPARNEKSLTYRPEIHSSPDRFGMQVKRGSQTTREGDVAQVNSLKKKWVKGSGYDRDGEDMYMKDIDSHVMLKAELDNMEQTTDMVEHSNQPVSDEWEHDSINRRASLKEENQALFSSKMLEAGVQAIPLPVGYPQIEEKLAESTVVASQEANLNQINNAHRSSVTKDSPVSYIENPTSPAFRQEQAPTVDDNKNSVSAKAFRESDKASVNTAQVDIEIRRNEIENEHKKHSAKVNDSPRPSGPPSANDVTIRDKLKLEINVMDAKELETPKIKKEKQKIKRFWQAVGTDPKDESKPNGSSTGENEKVIVTKVTKERKMSARSKASKASGQSVVHNRGDFNVTVEVK